MIRTPASKQIPKIMEELQTAADTLKELRWGVSIFGSARVKSDSPYYKLCEQLGAKLAKAGFPVIAGGGPGLMEAANKGAYNAGGTSIGLNIKLPRETSNNPYQTHSLNFDYFYSRKATFFMHSIAYIALPGGWGTMDELFEVMTLVQTEKLPPSPIVLIGKEFWEGLFKWVRDVQLGNGMISASDLNLVLITDSIDEAMEHLAKHCKQPQGEHTFEPALPES